jgi:hypothetical protein
MHTPPIAHRTGPASSEGRWFPPSLLARWHIPSRFHLAIAILVLLVLVSSGIAAWLLSQHPAQQEQIGRAFFVSSGLVDTTSNNGITDRLQIDLKQVAAPQSDNNYYAWLLNDSGGVGDALPIMLGILQVKDGHTTLSYQGNPQNANLLSKYSRFLVTEESASIQPANPSLEPANWRFSASLSRTPDPNDSTNHYSLLDHIRHLLAQDPKLQSVGISGGLDTWLYRNTLKILEWTGSARDAALTGDIQLTRRQLVRILDYLLSTQYIGTVGIPSDLKLMLADPKIARVALLNIGETQAPPGYLKHIGNHLRYIAGLSAATEQQKQLARSISKDLNQIQSWLEHVRDYAVKLVRLSPQQLQTEAALADLKEMFTQAHQAFVGKLDPNTNQLEKGVAQIHYDVQNLAILDVKQCTGVETSNFCG